MTRLYARGLGGARIHEGTPDSRWKVLTILGAISLRGMIATMTIEAATDREIFLAYLDECLCPKLQPGDVVVMDNLSSHKVDGVRQRIEKCGAKLLYLPPYSPDLNPIEKAWSKLKLLLRAAKARTREALDQAITELLPAITPDDANAWFRLPFDALQEWTRCSSCRIYRGIKKDAHSQNAYQKMRYRCHPNATGSHSDVQLQLRPIKSYFR
jgi:transposase